MNESSPYPEAPYDETRFEAEEELKRRINMNLKAWYVKPGARTAHEFNPLDPGIPMRATCGYKAWPQELIYASHCDIHPDRPASLEDPIYCAKCIAKG